MQMQTPKHLQTNMDVLTHKHSPRHTYPATEKRITGEQRASSGVTELDTWCMPKMMTRLFVFR